MHFISYSSADASDFAMRLCDALTAGPPSIAVWLDKRRLIAGTDWDEQIVEAIRDCQSAIFVMTRDSVAPNSVCKREWTRALSYKKPIIPIKLHADAEMPFRLEPRQYVDFTGAFEPALARLRNDLQYLSSPAGVLQQMKDRLADAQRDLQRAGDDAQKARILDDIEQLQKQIAGQQRVVDDPEGAAKRVQESIERGLERERQPGKPITGEKLSKFINPPPGIAPSYYQDRHFETGQIGVFLNDESLRMMTVVGRGGVGKTAMVCRLLKSLESGRLPDDPGEMVVDGIVYLSAAGSRRVNFHNIYTDLSKMLPDETAQRLDALYKNPQAPTEAKMRTLLEAFPAGRTILLLDNFEDVVDPESLNIRDAELDEALRALLNASHHGVKVIITTRVAPRDLMLTQPGRQRRLDLDEGLKSPFAENILREMDADGKLGLKSAPQELLNEARERTRGYPRALEALFAILSADRDTSLKEILKDTEKLLPDNVVKDLVGEAFSRLDTVAQQVMQALAVYRRPVTPAAVDYLLQSYSRGVNSAPVLNRLVNMQFARKESGRYFLHPVDRAYAFNRVPDGEVSDREESEAPPFTQFALLHRGAEYFEQARKPREEWKTIEDLAPQLAEFDLRCEGQDYDTAAGVLLGIDFDYLDVWGHYRLLVELHERLQGKLGDPALKQTSTGNLGGAYYRMGQYQKATACFELALSLAREIQDRDGESSWLVGLGNCYDIFGQIERAIDYHQQSMVIAREIGQPEVESFALNNLGFLYIALGQTAQAFEYFQQALVIHREFNNRLEEGQALEGLAYLSIHDGNYQAAVQYALDSTKIGIEIGSPLLGSYSNGYRALALILARDLVGAHSAVREAKQHEMPEHNHYVFALLGLIELRQGDRSSAREAFSTAIEQADSLLAFSSQNYGALDTKGLALSGLSLCGENRISAAIEAYRAARAITKAAGIVKLTLLLFDALAVEDSTGVLKEVRAAAAGE